MKHFHQLRSCWLPTFTFHSEPGSWLFFSKFTEDHVWFSPSSAIPFLPTCSQSPKVFLENNISSWLIALQSYKARGKKKIFNTTLRLLSSDTYSLQLYFKILLLVLITIFRTMLKLSRLWSVFRIPDEMLSVAFLGQSLTQGWFRPLLAYIVCYR